MQWVVAVERAEAAVPSDRDRILAEVRAAPGGAAALDARVQGAVVGAVDAATGSPVAEAVLAAACGEVEQLVALPSAARAEAMRYAAAGGHVAVMRRLFELGECSLEAKDDVGRTALMCASIGGNAEAVTALLELGADVTARNGHCGDPACSGRNCRQCMAKRGRGPMALDFARGGGNDAVVMVLRPLTEAAVARNPWRDTERSSGGGGRGVVRGGSNDPMMAVEGWLKAKGVDKDLPRGVAVAAAEAIVQMLPGEASSLEWLAGMHAAGELPAFLNWYMATARHKGGEFGFRRRPDATWQVRRPLS
jgi:hypothetical protein